MACGICLCLFSLDCEALLDVLGVSDLILVTSLSLLCIGHGFLLLGLPHNLLKTGPGWQLWKSDPSPQGLLLLLFVCLVTFLDESVQEAIEEHAEPPRWLSVRP